MAQPSGDGGRRITDVDDVEFRERYLFSGQRQRECRSVGHVKCDAPAAPPFEVTHTEGLLRRGGQLPSESSRSADTRPRAEDLDELLQWPPRDGRACRDDVDIGERRPPLPHGRHHDAASALQARTLHELSEPDAATSRRQEGCTLYNKSYPPLEAARAYED